MPNQAEVKEQVLKDWTSNAKPWRTWRAKFATQTAAVTKAIVEAAKLETKMTVLDLASGTGEPAFSIARAVGPHGHVTATDLVPEMLDVIRETMPGENVKNVTIKMADMEHLPFDDDAFDRVTSRFGIMFPPDALAAAKEMRRVLTPGGRVALAVWGPPTASFWGAFLGPFMKRTNLPPPPPDAPTPLRFAKPGSVSDVLREAGFSNVEEKTMTLPFDWPGKGEEIFRMQQEFVPQLFERYRSALSASDFQAALADMKQNFLSAESGDVVHLEGIVHIATGTR